MSATATLPALHPAHLEYLKVRGITEAAILAYMDEPKAARSA